MGASTAVPVCDDAGNRADPSGASCFIMVVEFDF